MSEIKVYPLRNIPRDLWDKAKHKAVSEGVSLRQLILELLEEYLDEEPQEDELTISKKAFCLWQEKNKP